MLTPWRDTKKQIMEAQRRVLRLQRLLEIILTSNNQCRSLLDTPKVIWYTLHSSHTLLEVSLCFGAEMLYKQIIIAH